MINRREFLRKAFEIGGLAALSSLGAGAIEEAYARGILPAILTPPAPVNISFATWDEQTQAGWGDSPNVYIVLFDATGIGDDEVGTGGGLSGADLVWAETGNVPAAVAGPKRQLAINYGFTSAANLITVINQATWTIIIKVEFLANFGEACFFTSAGNSVAITSTGAQLASMTLNAGGTTNTADAMADTGVHYIYAQADGIHNARIGWHTSKVGSWASIPAGHQASFGDAGDLSGVGATPIYHNGLEVFNNAAYAYSGYVYYIIAANKALLTY